MAKDPSPPEPRAQPPAALERPRPAVPAARKRFVGREVADVHGRRHDVPFAAPLPGRLDLAQRLTPAVYVDLGRPCNAACLYCAVPPHEDAQGFLPVAEVAAIAAAGRQAGCDRAILVGGEPTIHPHLDEVLQRCLQAGLRAGSVVMTNGLRLAKPGLPAWLAARGVATIHLSIDTVDAAIYQQLSRGQGRLQTQLDGLDAVLAEPALTTYIYTAVTALNLDGLSSLARHIVEVSERSRRPPPVWVLALVKPLGDGLRHADRLLVPPLQAARRLTAVVEAAGALGLTVGLRNVQACLAPTLVPHLVDYYLDDFSVELATGARLPFSHHAYWRKPASSCGQCGHQALCTGIYDEVARRFGVDDFVPIGRDGLVSDPKEQP